MFGRKGKARIAELEDHVAVLLAATETHADLIGRIGDNMITSRQENDLLAQRIEKLEMSADQLNLVEHVETGDGMILVGTPRDALFDAIAQHEMAR